jgi:NTP pyrophosphatase (non-canonical NTP hydrolase)
MAYEKMSIDELADEVYRWADKQFPDRNPDQAWHKLNEELAELFKEPKNPKEYADVFIVLLDLAALNGISLETEILTKLEINKMSNWVRDGDVMRRVKSPVTEIKKYHYPED